MSSSFRRIRNALSGGWNEPEDRGLTLPEAFSLLRCERRYWIVSHLTETNGAATTGELAELRASEETGCARELLSSDARKRVYISMSQHHLPKLVEADVVAKDRDEYVIADSPSARAVCDLVDVGEDIWAVGR